MYKLLLVIAMMTVWLSAHLLQMEEELAMNTLFQGKRAVNRAAHAAAQQLDKTALAEGELRIHTGAAASEAARYLQANLLLDTSGMPLPGSFLKHRVEVLVFEVINSEHAFPYVYRNDQYEFEAEFRKPGVVLIAKLVYPRAFAVMEPIEWNVKGAAEIYSLN